MAGATPAQELEVVRQSLAILQQCPAGATPPEIGMHVHRIVREITGNPDPYQEVKQEATQKALALVPQLRKIMDDSDDRLETALRISIAGNIIDFGPNPAYDLWDVVMKVLKQDFAINDLPLLRERLNHAERVLFLGDNAGEHVFDLLLIETLGVPVTYAVRGGPVLNDVTINEAGAIGMENSVELIDNGAQVPGTILKLCSSDFKARFNAADLILAKGMGNYETLSEVTAPIFFLLQVKCPIIGLDIGVPAGSTVIKQGMVFPA
jgi:uncharacterized protein with ATP-grasp and redox domains